MFANSKENEHHDVLAAAGEQSERDYLARCENIIRRLGADRFNELWFNPESVFYLIHDNSPQVRAAALYSGFDKWKLGSDQAFQQACREIAASDIGDARDAAIGVLGEMFYGAKRRDVQRILTPIMRDERLPNDKRNLVYWTLRKIEYGFEYEAVLSQADENAMLIRGESVPLADIDWEFIRLIESD